MSATPPPLAPEQRAALLDIARSAIRDRIRGTSCRGDRATESALKAPGAAFVTLTCDKELRGCIGYVEAVKPLAEAVAQCAVAAATADPRFPPVTANELPRLHVEISVLSPLRSIAEPQEVEVGLHGLFISQAGRHGLLLPQVAAEYGWDRETFLRQTCLKAGLPSDAWRRGATIQVFTVDRFTDGVPVG